VRLEVSKIISRWSSERIEIRISRKCDDFAGRISPSAQTLLRSRRSSDTGGEKLKGPNGPFDSSIMHSRIP
jgi:hypothetical protein